MKKILFGLIFIGAAITSCRKDHSRKNEPAPLQKVAFSVGFSKTVTNFQLGTLKTNSTTPDTSLTNYIDVLYYMVFDASGNSVHNIKQLSTDTAFGHYVDNLQAGTYTVVVAGGKTTFSVFSGSLSAAYLYYDANPGNPQGAVGLFLQDAFVSKISLTVSTTASSHAFALNRIVSKLVINVNDQIPASTSSLQAKINYAANIYKVGDGSTSINGGGLNSYYIGGTVPAGSLGTTNYQISGLVLNNTAQGVSVEITATGQTVLADKTVNGVTLQPNKITLLSGNLFGGSTNSTGGFQIATDTSWNTPIVRTF